MPDRTSTTVVVPTITLSPSSSNVAPEDKRKTGAKSSTTLSSLCYHSRTLYLLLASNMGLIVITQTAFATTNALAFILGAFNESESHHFYLERASSQRTTTITIADILSRLPLTCIWVVVNLLPFDLDNQRQPASVAEDRVNKPWRPIPTGRLTCEQAKWLTVLAYLTAAVFSLYSGGFIESIALCVLGVAYNTYTLGSFSFITRDMINGLGYAFFCSGGMDVALGGFVLSPSRTLLASQFSGSPGPLSPIGMETAHTLCPLLRRWHALIFVLVACTMHVQDFPDAPGDKLRGRSTVPLAIGDRVARYVLSSGCMAFSFIALRFWGLATSSAMTTGMTVGVAMVGGLALALVTSTLTTKSGDVKRDKVTVKLWITWLTAVYSLPLLMVLQ